MTSKRGTFGKIGKAETMMCITYPKNAGIIVSGATSGFIYLWHDEVLKSTIQGHQGPVFAIHALEKVRFQLLSCLTFSVQFCISYRKQSFDLLCKSNDWFLCEMQHWTKMNETISYQFSPLS